METEYDNFLELQVAAPGLSKDVFELHVENDVLTIAANGTAKAVDEHAKIKRKELDNHLTKSEGKHLKLSVKSVTCENAIKFV